jgi:hypothetical protein
MTSIKCPSCNLTNWATAISCKRCDFNLQEASGQSYEPGSFVSPDNSANFGSNSPVTQINTHVSYRPQQAYSRPVYNNPQNQKRGLAILSLVMGILSFPVINVMLGIILSIILANIFGASGAIIGMVVAVVLLPASLIVGIVALKKTKNNPAEYGGKGLATAGIVLSVIGLVTIPIVTAIAIPNVLAARRSANEASAISILKTIAKAEVEFASTRYKCGDLAELSVTQLINTELTTGAKNGYIFTVSKTPRGCDLFAKPKEEHGFSATGSRSFYFSTEDGKLKFSNIAGITASKESRVLETEGFPFATDFAPPTINKQNVNTGVKPGSYSFDEKGHLVVDGDAGKIF